MSALREFLRWPSDDDALAARYEDAFRRAAEERLSAALSEVHAHSMEVAASIVRTAAAIPPDSLLRLAHAPELEFRLRGARVAANGRAALAAFLCEALQAELLLLDDRVGAPAGDGVWTGLGDVLIAGDGREAPRVAATIAVDFDSPHNRGDIANRFAAHATPPERDRPAVVAALREAAALIAAASPQAERFTKAFTRVVVCIDLPGAPEQFGSFSSSWYPGRCVLINAGRMDVGELAAALVHEAIHSLIDVSELAGRLLRRPPAPGTTVSSPWTGATLSLQSLLDAYFVWYGLHWFWRAALARGAADAADAGERADLALRGFEPEFATVVGDLLPVVHGATVAAIEGLSGRARDRRAPCASSAR